MREQRIIKKFGWPLQWGNRRLAVDKLSYAISFQLLVLSIFFVLSIYWNQFHFHVCQYQKEKNTF